MPHAPADAITLVVFCRCPTPGSGKRRLARELGETTTVLISELLLATALEDAAAWPGCRIIAPAEPLDEGWRVHCPWILTVSCCSPMATWATGFCAARDTPAFFI